MLVLACGITNVALNQLQVHNCAHRMKIIQLDLFNEMLLSRSASNRGLFLNIPAQSEIDY